MNQTVSDYRFKFSVVTAVYNVEPYLAEAIESIDVYKRQMLRTAIPHAPTKTSPSSVLK